MDYPESLIAKVNDAVVEVQRFRKEPTYVALSNPPTRGQFETQVHYVLSENGFLPRAERITYGGYEYNPSGNRREIFLHLDFEIDVARGLLAYGYANGTAEIIKRNQDRLLLTDVEVYFQGLQKTRSGKVLFPHGRGIFEGNAADFSPVEISNEDLETFVYGYMTGALVNSPMPRSMESFSPATFQRMVKDCEIFLSENISDIRRGNNPDNIEEAGVAFWNVRNTDRVGFEKTWPKMPADRLDAAARKFGETPLKIGADGKIHVR